MSNVNEGHRARMRQRMIKDGLSGFQDHEVLELLLFQYLPRQDTNKLAHDLINKFGSFANVLDAKYEQLITVKGVSEVTACNLAMLKEVWQRYKRSSVKKISLSSLSSIIKYSHEIIADSYVEKLVVVYVDNLTNFLVSEEFTSDDSQEVSVDVKRIVASAVGTNAAGVILFHCHVNGDCSPSPADERFTEKLFVTLANINIVLLEHLIFNNKGEFYSFVAEKNMGAIAARYKKNT